MAELADALDSGSSVGNDVEVQVLSSAPNKSVIYRENPESGFRPDARLEIQDPRAAPTLGSVAGFPPDEDPLSRIERRIRESAPALSATGFGTPPATVSLAQIPIRSLASPTQPALTIRSEVREARRCLSARENRVIALLYDLGWRSREIAADLHVNESRVSQIKQRAITKLRLHLEPIRRAA